MFNQPIKRTVLTNIEEVKKYSYLMNEISSPVMTMCQNNGQIAYVDENGHLYVTPYRQEIHEILSVAGYKDGTLYVPFSTDREIPVSYMWLKKIAERENQAATHEKAHYIAETRNIMPVYLSSEEKMHIIEVSYYDDTENHVRYSAMANTWLFNGEEHNIGTYIIINSKTLLVCDEYARTFLIRVKGVINNIVNQLIDAGYRHNATPHGYVQYYDSEPLTTAPELPSNAIE